MSSKEGKSALESLIRYQTSHKKKAVCFFGEAVVRDGHGDKTLKSSRFRVKNQCKNSLKYSRRGCVERGRHWVGSPLDLLSMAVTEVIYLIPKNVQVASFDVVKHPD